MTDHNKVLWYAQRATEYPLPQAPDATGRASEPSCGDELVFGFKTHREIITEIGFTLTATACPPMFACAAVVAALAKDKAVLEAYLLKSTDIAMALGTDGTLDKEHVHCALMAELAFKKMIVAYSTGKSEALEAEQSR